jgi:disulfide bond formation protein DsbB
MDAMAETVLLVVVVVALLGFNTDPEAPSMLLFGGALLAIEKLVSIFHAHHYVKELLPVGTPDFTTRPS